MGGYDEYAGYVGLRSFTRTVKFVMLAVTVAAVMGVGWWFG